MIILKRIIDFFLYSNLWIALCAASLILESNLLFTGQLHIDALAATVLCSTLLLYATHRLIGLKVAKGFKKGRYFTLRKLEWSILTYAILSAIGLAYFFIPLSVTSKTAILLAGIPSLAYILPLFGDKKRLRDIHLIKVFLVAITWAYISIIIPLLHSNIAVTAAIIPLFLERFFFIFAITLPFDIRDLELDEFTKVKTIPSWLGVDKTKKIAYLLTLFSMVCALFSLLALQYSILQYIAVNLVYLLTLFIIKLTHKKRHDYFFTGLVDGLMLFHFMAIYLASFY